jgi:pyruvate-formate lyase-activating enzyme
MKKKTEEELLKTHVCLQPFRHIEFFNEMANLCCPTWLEKSLFYPTEDRKKYDYDVWNSYAAQEIRKSVSDGSYKYCNKELCPHLSTLISTGKNTGMFARTDQPSTDEVKWNGQQKFNFPFTDIDGILIEGEVKVKSTPGSINFTFDDSCNLKCPSCRLGTIMAKPHEVEKIDKIINFIDNNYAENCRKITITGSGDPFASKSFRKFLFNFNPKKWPNLRTIYIVSNGILFTQKNWDLMKDAQPYATDVEISIDAGTKDTYENKTRLGGKWEVLLENLKFISTIKTIKHLRISFIVQKDNYKEMYAATKLMCELFKERISTSVLYEATTIFFGRIAQWNHMTKEETFNKDVANPNHSEHEQFIQELKKAYSLSHKIHIQSNLTELLDEQDYNKSRHNKLL